MKQVSATSCVGGNGDFVEPHKRSFMKLSVQTKPPGKHVLYLAVNQVHFSGWNSPNQRSNDQWREALLGSITGAYRKASAMMIADTTMVISKILIFSLSEFARVGSWSCKPRNHSQILRRGRMQHTRSRPLEGRHKDNSLESQLA